MPRAEEFRKRDFLRRTQKVDSAFVARVVLFPALGGLLYGFDVGVTSYCVAQLEDGSGGVAWGSKVASSSLLTGVIASASLAGAFLASFALPGLAEQGFSGPDGLSGPAELIRQWLDLSRAPAVDEPTLSIIMPVLYRGLRVKGNVQMVRKSAVVVDTMFKLVNNPKDIANFAPTLLSEFAKLVEEISIDGMCGVY